MTARTHRIVVLTAGLRQPSSSRLLADRLASTTSQALSERGLQPEIEIVELREYARELTNHLLTGFPATRLSSLIERVVAADGLIAVSPIFSGSYSGLFKTFFDVLEPEVLAGKPVLLGATGGTARHSLALEYALRPLFSYLRTVVVPTAVYAAPGGLGVRRAAVRPGRPGRRGAGRPRQSSVPYGARRPRDRGVRERAGALRAVTGRTTVANDRERSADSVWTEE